VVKVHDDEGIANHIGPEPCAGIREGAGEASVGERTGQPLSYERLNTPGCRRLSGLQKATRAKRVIASASRPGVVADSGMYGSSLYGNREISCLTTALEVVVRVGKARSRSR
jgi:hypothetical protein